MDWLQLILGSSVILNAIAGIWLWYTKSYLPQKQKERQEEKQYQWETAKDQLDHTQQLELSAVHSSLSITSNLVEHLIEMDNGRTAGLAKSYTILTSKYQNLEGMMQIVTKDWSNMDEVLTDIDQILETIKSQNVEIIDLLKKIQNTSPGKS